MLRAYGNLRTASDRYPMEGTSDKRRTMVQPGRLVSLLVGVAAVVVAARHARRHTAGRGPHGGNLVGNAISYDTLSRFVLGSLFDGVAADIATRVQEGAQVLEVGCGPGHLAVRLAQHGLAVTGLDLDPAMIDRAEANAALAAYAERRPSFLVGDVASLPHSDQSFDLVVSTSSAHHWSDPAAGLAEIGRVLRPGSPALVWDLRRGVLAFHSHRLDPVEHAAGSVLQVLSTSPWPWPWKLRLLRRTEFLRPYAPDSAPRDATGRSQHPESVEGDHVVGT